MKPKLAVLALVKLISLFCIVYCQAQADKVDRLFSDYDNLQTPGAAVAIIQNGAIVFKKGYGSANLEYDAPITPQTVFHIASVSKQFTAFAILLLEQDGKLTLDDDIRRYIPEVPDFGKTITLRHLATHTSGLRDQWTLLSMAGWRLDDVITTEHILKIVSRQKDLNFDPGEQYLYCNTGFTLLGEVVRRVSGQTFNTFAKRRIFRPLGMNKTLFYDDHERIVKNRAYSYYPTMGRYKKSVLSYANVGATSLFTTAEDLSLWAMNFSDPQVGDSALIEKLNTLAVLNNGETFGGALGQFVGTYRGLHEIQHAGGDAGYRSYLTRFPHEDFAVVVLSNNGSVATGNLAHKVVDIYLNKEIKAAESKKPAKDASKVKVDGETLNSYVGKYELEPGFNLKITKSGGQLFTQGTNQPRLKLIPLSSTEFSVEGEVARVTFTSNGGDPVSSLKLQQNGRIMDAPRYEPFDKKSVNLADFQGKFYSEELATTYEFKVVGDKLLARHSRHSDLKLTPVRPDTFVANAWYFRHIKFTRDSEGKIIGCKVSAGRVRDLKFERLN